MIDFLWVAIGLACPVLLAAMAGYLSERSGVINIGLEGNMLMAACFAALGAAVGGPLAALGAGIIGACILAAVHYVVTQVFRVEHVVSGMAMNAVALGVTNFLYESRADRDASGTLGGLPLPAFVGVSLVVPLVLAWYAVRTRGGVWLTAVGEDPEKARLVGIDPQKVRWWAAMGCGVFCGLAGTYLVMDTGNFTDNMSAGRGYIALAALILGGWRPIPAMIAALGYGLFSALNLQMQGQPIFGIVLPNQAWSALPYIVTIIAMAGLLGRQRAPGGLGKA